MNIFYLDDNPRLAAQFMFDSHVVKMILETAQLLSTAHHKLGSGSPDMYKATHANHPSAKWVRESSSNYNWTYQHFTALCEEYTFRYGRVHNTDVKLQDILCELPPSIEDGPLTSMPLCMPDVHKIDGANPVKCYRHYYMFGKSEYMRSWRKRGRPEWFDC